MKSFLRGVLLLLCTGTALAVLAWRMGWWSIASFRRAVVSPSPSPVIVAQTPSPSPLPQRDRSILRIAVDERAAALGFAALPEFIKGHGGELRVQCVSVPDASLRWQMLAAGRVDVAIGTLDSFVLGTVRHAAGVMIFTVCSSAGSDVLISTPSVTSLPELSGKRVSVVSGTGGAYLLGYVLDRVGISPSQVHVVETEDPHDAAELLESGRVQAAWLWPPQTTRLLAGGFRKLSAAPPNILQEICAVNHTAVEQRRADVIVLMQYWFELESLVQNNPGLGREELARDTHHSISEVEQITADTAWTSLAENQKAENEDVASQMRRIQEFWRITGAPNSGANVDMARAVKVDLTREVEVSPTTSVFGNTASPSPAAASPLSVPPSSPQ